MTTEPRNPLDLPRLHMTDEEWEAFTDAAPFITYEMADGTLVYDEFKYVGELEFFDDRDGEIKLIKKTYRLLSVEEITLPDPYPIEDDDEIL